MFCVRYELKCCIKFRYTVVLEDFTKLEWKITSYSWVLLYRPIFTYLIKRFPRFMEAENLLLFSQQPWSGPIMTQNILFHTSTVQFLINLVLASHIQLHSIAFCGNKFNAYQSTPCMVPNLTFLPPFLNNFFSSIHIADTSIFLNKIFRTFSIYILYTY